MFQFQTAFPVLLPSLTDLTTEIKQCKEASEDEFKKAMTDFKNLVEKTLRHFHEKLHKIDKAIVYLGDNEDLGLSFNATAESVKTVWAPFSSDPRTDSR